MTTYTGYLLDADAVPFTEPSNSGMSTNLWDVDLHPSPFVDSPSMLSGAKSYGDAGVYPAGAWRTGFLGKSFVDDFYNRTHVTPLNISLGNVVSQVDTEVAVWNAYFGTVAMNSVVAQDAVGMTIIGLPAMPAGIGALRYNTYTLRTTTSGPPVIAAAFLFSFSSGEALRLEVGGRRILVFPFAPNWKTPVIESLEWKTDVLRAYDGTEQRRSLRVTPRRGFEYDILIQKLDVQMFESLLWGWHFRQFALPVWTDKGKLTAASIVGDRTVYINTTNLGFAVGALAVIYAGSRVYEAGVIESFTSGSLTFQFPLQQAWPAGSHTYPAVVAQIDANVPTQRHTDNVMSGKVSFATSPDITDSYLPSAAAELTYNGYEVITVKPNWRSAINNDLSHNYQPIDSGTGPLTWLKTETSGQMTRPYSYLIKNRAGMLAFRKMLSRLRGRSVPFYVPSWHDDMTVVATTAIGSASLTIDGDWFGNLVDVDTARDRIMIRMLTGEVYYRRITDTSVVGTTTVIGLDATFPIFIDPVNVKRVHLLHLCRMASDKVEIPWRTDAVADPQLTFVTVPK